MTPDEIPPGSMTEWERNKELHEFSRASELYKPLSNLMSSRFTSAKYEDNDNTVEVPAEEGVRPQCLILFFNAIFTKAFFCDV